MRLATSYDMKKAGSLLLVLLTLTASAKALEVSDSLVKNLSCQSLSVENIYKSIRDDAFHEKRNIPMSNWEFRMGAAPLAVCWGLSSTQRVISYLARYNTPLKDSPTSMTSLFDILRGATIHQVVNQDEKHFSTYLADQPIQKLSVFAVESDSLAESEKRGQGSLWNLLEEGYTQKIGDFKHKRSFKNEIEANQGNHFFQAANLAMVVKSAERSREENEATIELLKSNLDQRKLTLVNLRLNRTTQHIVMAKSYKVFKGTIVIEVYDSNSPEKDQYLYFDTVQKRFYAPEIFYQGEYLGAYVVSEEERGLIEDALMKYYQNLCNSGN
ncbi:hypothetical protein [uncultured Bdellovibrio sp.]|uniref:hypothetical protein n=1 Tax=Bdellovibrio sp. HCB-162 TaxID=3394234 RepID=UPI00260135C0|nr:hypothetical protein [uncultured Bdellovibrio sp.]